MSAISYHRRSANEKNMDELNEDTNYWNGKFRSQTEEMVFLKALLTSNVFENSIPNLFEKLQEFYDELSELKDEKINLEEAVRNHKNDLNGMMECEDISCESFYHSEHQKLTDKISKQLALFQDLKMRIFRFCTPLLKKNED